MTATAAAIAVPTVLRSMASDDQTAPTDIGVIRSAAVEQDISSPIVVIVIGRLDELSGP